MITVICKNAREHNDAVRMALESGLRLGCIAHVPGIPMGHMRLTFLPESAFSKWQQWLWKIERWITVRLTDTDAASRRKQ